MTARDSDAAARRQTTPWWSTALVVLSVSAVMAACFSSWFDWTHSGSAAELRPGQRTGLGLPLPHFDFSATASYTTATPADAGTVHYVTWSARCVVAVALLGAVAALVRSRRHVASAVLKMLCSLLTAITIGCGLLLLGPGWLWAAALSDVEQQRIGEDAPVHLAQVLPWGPILLGVAVVLQVAAWRLPTSVRSRPSP